MKAASKPGGYHLATRIRTALVITLTVLSALIILIPVYWMVNTAFRPLNEILVSPPKLIPTQLTTKFVAKILATPNYRRYILNSFTLASGTLVVTMSLALLAGYGFSRFRMPGGRFFLVGMLALIMIPRVTLIIPYYRLSNMIGLYDTLLALILVISGFMLPLSTWLMKGFIDSIPKDLEEAAMIDGCSMLQAIWQVVIPLVSPGMIGVGAYVFISSWNDFMLSFTMTQSVRAQTITIGIAKFFSESMRDWSSIMALTFISIVPLFLLFVFFQKWVIQGLTSGSVK